jgi:hypothetical protein
VWVFDVAWALAVFFGLRSGAARLLAVRIGTPAALGCGALGLGAGLGLPGSGCNAQSPATRAVSHRMRLSPSCRSWRRWLSSRCLV